MGTPAVEGIDLFKIANRSISGWVPSSKADSVSHTRQPFCSQLEERLILWLEYHPQVARYAWGDIGREFAMWFTFSKKSSKHTLATFKGRRGMLLLRSLLGNDRGGMRRIWG